MRSARQRAVCSPSTSALLLAAAQTSRGIPRSRNGRRSHKIRECCSIVRANGLLMVTSSCTWAKAHAERLRAPSYPATCVPHEEPRMVYYCCQKRCPDRGCNCIELLRPQTLTYDSPKVVHEHLHNQDHYRLRQEETGSIAANRLTTKARSQGTGTDRARRCP